ncbi:MAG: hypothetical protein ACR2GV_00195 [Gaiellaceae bacterium]
MLVERLSRSRGQGDCPQRTVGLTVGLDDALDDRAADGDDARLVVDVGALERHPFARPQARERGEHRKWLERGGELRGRELELVEGERPDVDSLGLRVRNECRGHEERRCRAGQPEVHHAR